MKTLMKVLLVLVFTSGVALAEEEYVFSGFLGDYSRLAPAADGSGALVYLNPQNPLENYTKIMLDPIIVYSGDSDHDDSGNEGDEEEPSDASSEPDAQGDDNEADASPDTGDIDQPADLDPQETWDGDPELSPEEQQALEQWLRQVPDDPGGLLRRKFLRQYQEGQRTG